MHNDFEDSLNIIISDATVTDFIIYNWIFNTLFIFIFTLIMMRLAINFKKIIINNFKTKIFYHFNIRI